MSDFCCTKIIKSLRKVQSCPHCMHNIGIGEPAIKWTGRTLDGFYESYCHDDCYAAGEEYNKLYKQIHNEELHYSEYWQLRYIDETYYVWLTTKYPDVAARLNIQIDSNIGKTYSQQCVVSQPLKAGDVVYVCSPVEQGWRKLSERKWFTPEGKVFVFNPDMSELIVVKRSA